MEPTDLSEPLDDTLDDGIETDTSDDDDSGDELVDDELLVEEISIDGMCGVY